MPDRWQRIEDLYHRALELPAAERAAFLDEVCAGDPALRSELDSLLAEGASSFMRSPAIEQAARDLAGAGPLVVGQRIGSFTILALAGRGNMGEVYRARDASLHRDVALKMLPETLASDLDRLARFQREAEVLASLNHPNIATIHGIDDVDGRKILVLEFVDGITLADRLASEAIPVDEAIQLARQVTDALDSAHARGVVHRDIKPANIKIATDGRVKVLDFGIAKVTSAPWLDDAMTAAPSSSATREGIIIGTPAYMSPEQARGGEVDKRADIWAFGCVLYEMLTGRLAFAHAYALPMGGAPGRAEPDFDALPAATPSPVRRLLRRCLEPDPRRRLRDIGDAWSELDAAAEPPAPVSLWTRRAALIRMGSAAALGSVATAAGVWKLAAPSGPPLVQYRIPPPPGTRLAMPAGYRGIPAGGVISPDGSRLAFTARDSSNTVRLYVQRLQSLVAEPLTGTEGAALPFWNPDSRRIAFFSAGTLKIADVEGAAPRTVCLVAGAAFGGTWNRDGEIVFASISSRGNALYRVREQGGDVHAVTPIEGGLGIRMFPCFLPDGQHFVYFLAAWAQPQIRGIYWGALDPAVRHVRLDMDAHGGAVFAPPDYLMFVRDGTLYAQRIDQGKGQTNGSAIGVADSVRQRTFDRGVPSFSVSGTGLLAYRADVATRDMQLTWLDRKGAVVGTIGRPGPYAGIDLSRDGRIAVHEHFDNGGSIVVIHPSGATTRITFEHSADSSSPVFSPDGRRLAFAARRSDRWGIYLTSSDGNGPEQLLHESNFPLAPMTWVGSSLYFWTQETSQDMWQISTTDGTPPTPLLNGPAAETHTGVPDSGAWMAYLAGEGTEELNIYARLRAHGGEPVLVSPEGGVSPRVRRDGTEVFFASWFQDAQLMAAPVNVHGSTLEVGAPETLFDLPNFGVDHTANFFAYAVHPDGQRFLMPVPVLSGVDQAAVEHITIVSDWMSLVGQ